MSRITAEVTYDKPIPERASWNGRVTKYPFGTMNLGGSFWVSTGKNNLQGQAKSFCKRHHKQEWVFYCETELNDQGVKGTRCWRTK